MKLNKLFASLLALSVTLPSVYAAASSYEQGSIRGAHRGYNQIRAAQQSRFESEHREQIATPLAPHIVKNLRSNSKKGELSEPLSVQLFMDEVYGTKMYIVTSVECLGGGFVSGDIYRVNAFLKSEYKQGLRNNKQFYIKYLRAKPVLVSKGRLHREQVNLLAIQRNLNFLKSIPEKFTDSFDLAHQENSLEIIIPDAIQQYRVGKTDKVFMILPSAQGKSLAAYVRDVMKGDGQDVQYDAEEVLSEGEELSPNGIRRKEKGKSVFSFFKRSPKKRISPTSTSSSSGSDEEDQETRRRSSTRSRSASSAPVLSHAADIESAFGALGKAFGAFHRTNSIKPTDHMPRTVSEFAATKVYVHGDLHGENVFFDEETKKISLIDVETMADSFGEHGEPTGIMSYDFLYMLLMSDKHFGNSMKKLNWTPFKSYLSNYINEFTKDHGWGIERQALIQYWIDVLKKAPDMAYEDHFRHFTMNKGFSSNVKSGARNIRKFLEGIATSELGQFKPSSMDEYLRLTTPHYQEIIAPMPVYPIGDDEDSDTDDDDSGHSIITLPTLEIIQPVAEPIAEPSQPVVVPEHKLSFVQQMARNFDNLAMAEEEAAKRSYHRKR